MARCPATPSPHPSSDLCQAPWRGSSSRGSSDCYFASSIRFQTYPYPSFHLEQHFPTSANRHHGLKPGFILLALLCLISAVASHLYSSFYQAGLDCSLIAFILLYRHYHNHLNIKSKTILLQCHPFFPIRQHPSTTQPSSPPPSSLSYSPCPLPRLHNR